jgi:hypothetical protein
MVKIPDPSRKITTAIPLAFGYSLERSKILRQTGFPSLENRLSPADY